ncbi:hypothetical protein BBJ28_00026796 [Nothophytophthora sp. Chile5]|nr:hypothetical protein BBJ28_00026796 [Nothophytophthora sp. Chile5]
MPRQRARDPPAPRDSQATRDVSRGHVEAVLLRLHGRRIEREQKLRNYPTARPHDVESECTDSPHFGKFRDIGGSAAIEDMTNFTTREFNELWLSVHGYVMVNYKVGRGRATRDITMFKNNKAFHQSKMKKLPGDENLQDQGPLKEKFPDEWADKGYQGLASNPSMHSSQEGEIAESC